MKDTPPAVERAYQDMLMARSKSIRLGRYADAVDDDGLPLDPTDRVRVRAAIIRDDVLRRHPERREAFDRGPVEGLGRFSVHWP